MSGAERPFLDSSIIVYLMSGEVAKASRAGSLIASGGVISTQVLNEFTSVARRKLALTWVETEEVLQALKASHEVAALVSGCYVVVSEDMQHRQMFTGLRIANPFL